MFFLDSPQIGLDTETTGLNYPVDKAFGVAVAGGDGQSHYWDFRHDSAAIRKLNDAFEKYSGVIVCHNASFDYKMCFAAGLRLPLDQFDDTVVRACCINEHEWSYSLDDLAKKYLKEAKTTEIYAELAKIFGGLATRNVQMRHISRAPREIVEPYIIKDAELALRLWQWQEREINKQGIQDIVKFERGLMPLFIETEMQGIRVDINEAEKAIDLLQPEIAKLQHKVNTLAGTELNVDSSPQVKKVYAPLQLSDGTWATKNGHPIGTTPNGGPSLGADVLKAMKDPLAQGIIELRTLLKTRDTFLTKHVLGHAHNGRVYPSINQSKGEDGGTGTGRLSYQGPAMQQIPNRNKKIAAIVKRCFLPEEGQIWLDADMASFEVRIFAHLVAHYNDAVALAYAADPEMDLHQWVATLMGIPRNKPPEGGANAKQLNLSMIFNTGNGAVADELGLPWEWCEFRERMTGDLIRYKKAGHEATRVIELYHQKVPGVKLLASEAEKLAKSRGYVKTFTGRRLRFPDQRFCYKASGLLIQSTSADINKQNWALASKALKPHGRLLLNTHDSYSMSVPEDWQGTWARVKSSLENNRGFKVPLIADLNGAGSNWWDAIKDKK